MVLEALKEAEVKKVQKTINHNGSPYTDSLIEGTKIIKL